MSKAGEDVGSHTIYPDCAIFYDQAVNQEGRQFSSNIVTGWLPYK